MDHTLIRYNTENFERLSHTKIVEKLISRKGYPEQVKKFQFDFHFALRGLVVDRKKGNSRPFQEFEGPLGHQLLRR